MIHIQGAWLKDEFGRTRLLRGVNLGGSSKLPTTPDGATYRAEGFYDSPGGLFRRATLPAARGG